VIVRRNTVYADRLTALAVGLAVLGALCAWPFALLGPETWEGLASACAPRPPAEIFPGVWRLLMAALARACAPADVLRMLPWMGRAAAALAAAALWYVFRDTLRIALSPALDNPRWHARLGRVIAALGSFVLMSSEPAVRLFQSFGPVALDVTLAVTATACALGYLRTARLFRAWTALFLTGLLAGDTPVGFVFAAATLAGGVLAQRYPLNPAMPFVNPFGLLRTSKWALSAAFLLGFSAAFGGALALFSAQGGFAAWDASVTGAVTRVAADYVAVFLAAARPLGWLTGLLVAVLPAAVAFRLVNDATNPDAFLTLRVGVIALLCGILGFGALLAPAAFHWWNWGRPALMPEPGLQFAFLVFSAFAFTASLASWSVEMFLRNHYYVGLTHFPELMDGAPVPIDRLVRRRRVRLIRRAVFYLLPLAIVLATLPSWRQRVYREALRLVDAAVRATLVEAAGAECLVTDGALDPILELQARAKGLEVIPMSMMGAPGGREAALRLRLARDEEDRLLLGNGAANALQAWCDAKPRRLATCAVQLGFELWNRRRLPLPPLGGFVARPGGMDATVRARGVATARALGERIAAFYAQGGTAREAAVAGEKLEFVQWRISRLARLRAQGAQGDERRVDAEMAEKLDAANAAMQDMLARLDWVSAQQGDRLTPREGLGIALKRADFAMGRRFAIPLLNADPDDPDANFAVGMSHFIANEYAQAEKFLLRVLVRKPKEPSVLNNLAIVRYRQGRLTEALADAEAAFRVAPDSPEIKATLEHIRREAAAPAASARK